MAKVDIIDHTDTFAGVSDDGWEVALAHMAIDIVRLSQMQVPHDTGRLQSSKTMNRIANKRWEIRYQTNYAETTHENPKGVKFKKGRKDHYLSDPGKQISGNAHGYFAEAMSIIKGKM